MKRRVGKELSLPVDETWSVRSLLEKALEGKTLVWQGNYHAAKFKALELNKLHKRQFEKENPVQKDWSAKEEFLWERERSKLVAQVQEKLVLEFNQAFQTTATKAPQKTLEQACSQALGSSHSEGNFIIPVNQVLGMISSMEWRKNGVLVDLGSGETMRVYPHFGVFPPTRNEYAGMLMNAKLPTKRHVAIDVGTGTGLLGAILLKRGVSELVATDTSMNALVCAQDNLGRLGVLDRVTLYQGLFPPSDKRADVIVCNPPWIPATQNSPLDQAVYDPESEMLRSFLEGVPSRLESGGVAFLVMSDLAERIGLRPEGFIESLIERNGMKIVHQEKCSPTHPKARGRRGTPRQHLQPLRKARSEEQVSLFSLQHK